MTSIIAFFILICVLVFVHEYGHFWAARKCGVKVIRFS
ncbi:TPA: site-2 protease family protein, partial [Mannheimia haemolytica]|nr:site-2 protease family protein [Mannheimia haemolytica]